MLLAIACALIWLGKVVRSNRDNQWDFRVYYSAAEAWNAGQNPYDPAVLRPAAGEAVYPFVYPPCTLPLFALFTHVPLALATNIFLGFKIGVLVWLLVTWTRLVRAPIWHPAWVLFLVFAYSSCIFVDFASGNITTLEQAILWPGIASLLQGRRWPYVWAVVAASLFKLTPIALLAVLPLVSEDRSYRYVAAGVAVFAGVLAVTYWASPLLTREFVRSAMALDERGRVNPALLALIRDSAAIAAGKGWSIGAAGQTAAYVAMATGIVAVTGRAIVRTTRRVSRDAIENAIYIAVLAYALALPRFKNYSYMLLIVPTYCIATRATRLPRAVPLLLLASLPVYTWLTTTQNVELLANYSQYLIAFAAWATFLYELRVDPAVSAAVVATA